MSTEKTTELEAYLASEQAAADVARLLRAPAIMDYANVENRQPASIQINGLTPWWHLDREGAWRRVWLEREYRHDEPVLTALAYFRPDANLYTVTDMGEAVRAVRLRTANMHLDSDALFGHVSDLCGNRRDALYAHRGADDLPRAICAVMLAAYRVSRLTP